ncbi:MAG: regulatory protein GemA [Hyphomonadaceae bacterium]|jgi:hypothetical protein|nr:regulatory protein GemA [Hyphomonadaceae bacterium]
MNRALHNLVHVGARELGLDAEARRDLQLAATGKASLKDMTDAEVSAVIERLKAAGFTPAPARGPGSAAPSGMTGMGGKPGQRPAASRADVRFAHVLWRLLADAGEARVRGAPGLNAFIRARFGEAWGAAPIDIDAMRDGRQIAMVIEALKDWCARAGIEVGQ